MFVGDLKFLQGLRGRKAMYDAGWGVQTFYLLGAGPGTLS